MGNKIGGTPAPKSVPFMVQQDAFGKLHFKKGSVIKVDGQDHRIMSIHSVELLGGFIQIFGKSIPWEVR